MAKKRMTEVVNIRVSAELKDELERAADLLEISVGDLARKVLKAFVWEQTKMPPARRAALLEDAAALRGLAELARREAGDA